MSLVMVTGHGHGHGHQGKHMLLMPCMEERVSMPHVQNKYIFEQSLTSYFSLTFAFFPVNKLAFFSLKMKCQRLFRLKCCVYYNSFWFPISLFLQRGLWIYCRSRIHHTYIQHGNYFLMNGYIFLALTGQIRIHMYCDVIAFFKTRIRCKALLY